MKQAFRAWIAYNIMAQILGAIAAAIGAFMLSARFLDAWPTIAGIAFVGMNLIWFILWLWYAVLEPWTEK